MDSFLNCVVSNTALAGVLAFVAFGIQKCWRSPQLAHALWFLVLVKLVTPPVFYVALPDRFGLSASSVAAPRSSGHAESLRLSADAARALAPTVSPLQPAGYYGEPIEAAVDPPAGAAEMTATSPPSTGMFAISSLATLIAASWQGWLCATWAGGVILGVVILRRRLGRFRTLLIEAVDADIELVDDVRAFAKRLGLRSCPSIRVLDAHVPPLVCADWRSLTLLIPARLLRELDRDQLHAVLVHELAHIRRRDHLVRWIEIIVRGLFWWNPLVWWASRQLRQAEEECCDAWVLWALPESNRSYGKALLWTVEFLAERRTVSVVAGTAFSGSLFKRRIELIMNQKLNHRMSWSAFVAVIVLGMFVLPAAAQKRSDDGTATVHESTNDPKSTPSGGGETDRLKSAVENRDIEARIEHLERLVQELSETVKRPAADNNTRRQINKGERTIPREIDVWFTVGRQQQFMAPRPETEEDRLLKKTLVALEKQAWDAAGKGDSAVYEKLLADDYFGFYANSSGIARTEKATSIAAVKRRRYFDVTIRDADARRIGKDAAILTYIYSCKVEEAGQLQIYRDHQATQVWTQKNDGWVQSFSQDFVLPGGE